ncbi:HAD hydrolase-like protein [Oscillibacter sp.]|uniref:HAD hydrolase-like protein n=1 Tax=Oscillibacter sp. TaxID=1945593 RepID=UPI0028B17B12|nr:HAD hydrolase-like protein [Oscillibacter sp.]
MCWRCLLLNRKSCVWICARFGYTPSLSVIAGGLLHGDYTKADVIRDTFRRLNLSEADRPHILMVGDRKYDVLGAKACGVDCVGVEFFGYAAPGELEEAGALAVVHSAAELEQFILAH